MGMTQEVLLAEGHVAVLRNREPWMEERAVQAPTSVSQALAGEVLVEVAENVGGWRSPNSVATTGRPPSLPAAQDLLE